MTTEAGKRVVGDLTIGYVSVPKGSWNECEALATVLVAAIEGEAVLAERERIANLLPRFMHGEMFDETPESDLDLDATAFAMGERFRFLIGAYPYREATDANG